ncbi:MAG: Hsp70 family protein, partial [Verrucomicrobiota bacterium]
MSTIVGIDLGTTNSLVAIVESGIPYVLADVDGQRLTPSVVHLPAGGGAPLVGHAANRVRVLHPERTLYSTKRFMGRRGSMLTPEDLQVTYPVQRT